ncbi:hypothetical protein I4641_20585 [Waterburya agarophytonicola K14]|uniref:Uncharacterized protein n=1 Tax=Waterburya agarophytonicola KI4 TaxID=2874699 RepID=A0A964BVI1_9CYAN|nr:hypothetical protein [Waterburya agarophytonicola]MCC0179362.1 hypothetical protein [Waterburya agarophytonicola KI4]
MQNSTRTRRWFFLGTVIAGIVAGLGYVNKNKLGDIIIQVCNQVETCNINQNPEAQPKISTPSPEASPEGLSKQDYLKYVVSAMEVLSIMPKDVSVSFPIGTTKPLGKQVSTQEFSSNSSQLLYVIGYIDQSKKVMEITSEDLISIINQQANELYVEIYESNIHEIATFVSVGNLPQSSQQLAVSLLVYNPQTQQISSST